MDRRCSTAAPGRLRLFGSRLHTGHTIFAPLFFAEPDLLDIWLAVDNGDAVHEKRRDSTYLRLWVPSRRSLSTNCVYQATFKALFLLFNFEPGLPNLASYMQGTNQFQLSFLCPLRI